MSPAKKLCVVFGSNGPLGQALIRELQKRDDVRIRAVSRSGGGLQPEGVERMAADALDLEATRKASKKASVIFHCMNVPYSKWSGTLEPMMANLMAAAEDVRAKLVYADNVYAYGNVDGSLRETLPWEAATRKGRIRANILRMLEAGGETGDFSFTVGMASDFYGPGATQNAHLGTLVFERILKGQSAQYVGIPHLPHSFTYLPDMAADLVTLAFDARADNRTWHVRNAPALSFEDLTGLLGQELEREIGIQSIPPFLLRMMGLFNRDIREIGEMLYQFRKPFIVDDSDFRNTFGGEATALVDGLHTTLEWFRKYTRVDEQSD